MRQLLRGALRDPVGCRALRSCTSSLDSDTARNMGAADLRCHDDAACATTTRRCSAPGATRRISRLALEALRETCVSCRGLFTGPKGLSTAPTATAAAVLQVVGRRVDISVTGGVGRASTAHADRSHWCGRQHRRKPAGNDIRSCIRRNARRDSSSARPVTSDSATNPTYVELPTKGSGSLIAELRVRRSCLR